MKHIILLSYILFSLSSFADETPNREARELKMAETLILNDLAPVPMQIGQNTSERCRQGIGCSEIALALIAARSSKQSLTSLVSLIRFNMDGAISEDYNCYVINKGNLVILKLKSLDAKHLVNQCHAEVARKAQTHDQDNENYLNTCASEEEIKNSSNMLIQSIKAGRKCEEGDF